MRQAGGGERKKRMRLPERGIADELIGGSSKMVEKVALFPSEGGTFWEVL